MLKKIFIFFTCTILINSAPCSPVGASFFKKSKVAKKEVKKEVQKIPKLVTLALIYASWCPGCKNIQPTIDQVEKEFSSQVEIVYFDVSTPKQAIASAQKAKELNLLDFYNSNKSKTSTAAIFVSKTKETVSTFQNNNKLEDYKATIQEALTKAKVLENPPT